jgi:hypothetical protein
MAKYSRFDPRNKKKDRHKRNYLGVTHKTQKQKDYELMCENGEIDENYSEVLRVFKNM